MQEIVLKIDKKNEEALGAIRCIDGLRLATDGHFIWLRGILYTETLDIRLRQLPVLQSYFVNEIGLLFLDGHFTPIEKLPEMHWQPLTDYLEVSLPVSFLPGKMDKQIPFVLKPSEIIRSTIGLMTSLAQWKQYAETVSTIRLSPLRFAVSTNETVMIMGAPPPAIPGKEYWQLHNLLIPVGLEPAIGMAARFFDHHHNPDGQYYLLHTSEGQWQPIEKASFVPAKRSGIRLSGAQGSSAITQS